MKVTRPVTNACPNMFHANSDAEPGWGILRVPRGAALVAVVSIMLVGCQTPPEPYYAGDAVEGRQVAEQLCSSCHALGQQGVSPNPAAPPFRIVLGKYDEASLVKDLDRAVGLSHLKMPTFHLGDGHAKDLVAFMRSIPQTTEGVAAQ